MKRPEYLLAVLALALALGSEVARAQVAISTDIGVTLTATPTTGLSTGQPINLTLTATNYGPTSTSILVLDSSMFTNQFENFVTNPSECYLVGTIVDGTSPSSYVSWYVSGLPGSAPFEAGETLTCHFQFALSAQAPAVVPFSFSVSSYDPDINMSNDIGTVVLQRAADPIPALSSMMLWLLAGLLVLVRVLFDAAPCCNSASVRR
jgi:hypothetical protein